MAGVQLLIKINTTTRPSPSGRTINLARETPEPRIYLVILLKLVNFTHHRTIRRIETARARKTPLLVIQCIFASQCVTRATLVDRNGLLLIPKMILTIMSAVGCPMLGIRVFADKSRILSHLVGLTSVLNCHKKLLSE